MGRFFNLLKILLFKRVTIFISYIKSLNSDKYLQKIQSLSEKNQIKMKQCSCLGRTQTVDILIQNGANVSATNKQGSTPLNIAAEGGNC